MSSVKRKAVTDERPNKKVKSVETKTAEKPPRASGKKDSAEEKKSAPKTSSRKTAAQSVLQQEEKAFPRGGASVLTPLEHRQIQAEAERDALLEHETGEKRMAKDENGELFGDEVVKSRGKKATTRTAKKSKPGKDADKAESSGVKVHGLSYKNLVVGSTVLGRITAVTDKDIALALSNNLTGYVPITAVSEVLTTRIERVLAQDVDMDEADDDNDDDDEDIDLKALFQPGQWLRAIVTASGSNATEVGGKAKRHIELSIDPSQVNEGLTFDTIVPNSMIQASVRSVEDHGVIMDLGLTDDKVKAFVSKKELGKSHGNNEIREGQVLLGVVTGKSSSGKVINLSFDPARYSATSAERPAVLNDASTIDAFRPGTAANVLVVESGAGGVVGKIMGMLDVTADLIHIGSNVDPEEISKKYKIGSKVKARIIWTLPQDDDTRAVGISLLEQTLALTPRPPKLPGNATTKSKSLSAELDQVLPTSTIIEEATVTRVMPERGLLLSVPSTTDKKTLLTAFAHISQISDERIDVLSSVGPYKPESVHRARVLAYNPVDNLHYVSLKPSILDQTFLRVEDVKVAQTVKGTVEKLILGGAKGVTGVLVKISNNVTGLVPEMHFSDVQLQHPEKKFREGYPITARVLSVDLSKRQIRLTLKKSLLEEKSSSSVWKDYEDLKPGMETKGTIVNLLATGAVVQFFGSVRAWLPVAEFSETYVEKPEEHFRLGQTVKVRIMSVDPAAQEMKVSARDESVMDSAQQSAWDTIEGGQIVDATVTEKSPEAVSVELANGLKGTVRIGHLGDASGTKVDSLLKRIRVGQKMSNLLVLGKHDRSQTLLLSNKSSMVADAKDGRALKGFADVAKGSKVHGFVRNVTSDAVYVEFVNETVGLVGKAQLLPELLNEQSFGLRKDQSVTLWITHVDLDQQRFFLSMREPVEGPVETPTERPTVIDDEALVNPVDESVRRTSDLTVGRVLKARIASIKATQINVRLAEGVQGRVDISEVFDSWEDIDNKSVPLQKFKPNELITVKILGMHDARNHRFLPISHRQGKVPVYELSAKKSRIEKASEALLSLESVQAGSTVIAFVNNHGDSCVWVNLSPNVRGRVALMDLSDDVGALQDIEKHFRIGRALRTKVKSVDVSSNRLDLVARQLDQTQALTLQDLSPGMTLPARVTKVTQRAVVVQLADDVVGSVPLVELSDDFDQASTAKYHKNDIVRVCVLEVDLPNKKTHLSLRPSRVLSSSLPVQDKAINTVAQLKSGDIVRGFVKHIAEKGVIVALSARVDARVWISDLSDNFIKEWQSIYSLDELVKGRITSVDPTSKEVRLSLKRSQIDANYEPPLQIQDLKAGQIVTGVVRKIEDFGAFIDIDNTTPRLSGLCHKSEVAAKPVADVRKLYSPGDVVKARVMKVEVAKRRISLSLKAKYFQKDIDADEDEEMLDADDVNDDDDEVSEDEDEDGGVDLRTVTDLPERNGGGVSLSAASDPLALSTSGAGLRATGFDWTGDNIATADKTNEDEAQADDTTTKKRKRKAEIQPDLTGDVDRYGARSADDFERQLLGRPNDSGLWIEYMAFQLQANEVQLARDIAQRAIRTIHIRETEEKGNVWIAWLNLEVEYGDEDRVEEVFKEACQVQDSLEMHEKLASIYIDSGKHDRATAIFDRILANKTFRASPDVWLNYATFLMNNTSNAADARALLPRALQSLPIPEHRPLTAKFAALEFHSPHGDAERGRTIFEGLVEEWPNWHSGWDTYVDLERAQISKPKQTGEGKKAAREKVRALFERMAAKKMKKRRAKFLFKKWLEFEEAEVGGKKAVDRVQALAREYVERVKGEGEDGAGEE